MPECAKSPMRSMMVMAVFVMSSPAGAGVISSSADAQVKALADTAWAATIDRDPIRRLGRGLPILNYPDISEAAYRAEVAEGRRMLAALSKISTAELSEDARLTYDVLREQAQSSVEAAPYYWLNFQIATYKANPDFMAFHQLFAAHSLQTDAERRQYVHLLDEYLDLIVQHHRKLLGQEKRGLRLPKSAIDNSLQMLDGYRKNLPANLAVFPDRLASFPSPEATAFSQQVDQAIATRVRPAFDKLIAYMSGEYRTKAPDAVSVSQYPGGADYYRVLTRAYTTLNVTPEQLHALGLKRVAELEARIKAAASKAGLTGGLPTIYAALRKNTRFYAHSPEEVESYYLAQIDRIKPKIPLYFSDVPKAPYGVQRLPPELEKSSTFGTYSEVSAVQPKGLYVYNGSELDKRSLLTAQAIIYHELIPGHYFQIELAAENTSLHPIRRNFFVSGFGEGWGEYASSLGYEMGLYNDPYADIGRSLLEMFLTARLVVDTGIGFYGWPFEKARDYMRRHVFLSDGEIESETVRYGTRPAQALAYRMGFEKIWELRHRAEHALGPSFDLKAFHRTILMDGTLPLSALDAKIDRWIERERRSGER